MFPYKNTGPVDCIKAADVASKIKGRTAIVTGGASGLGAAYVRALSKAGAYVVIADLDEAAAKKMQQEFPDTSAAVRCDVTKWNDQLAAFKKAKELSPEGSIDIVVANAGIAGSDSILQNDVSLDEPAEPSLTGLNVNMWGVFYTVKLALWYFEKQRANGSNRDTALILKASLAGYLDLPSPQYAASKFGVRGLMRALRHTAGQHGTRVNLLAPWYVHTPIIGTDLNGLIEKSGTEYATVEDAAAALLKIAGDETVIGRAFAIVPKTWKNAPHGYLDLEQDDFEDGTWMGESQKLVFKPLNAAAEQQSGVWTSALTKSEEE